jgi:uncharacterized protein involved in exopolysaccharide biosynthesis
LGQGDRDDYKLHDLLAIFWRWRRLAAGAFLAILIPGVLVIFLMPPVYEATASILVNRVNAAPAYSVKTSPAVDPLSVVRNSHNAEEVKTAGEMIKTRATIDRVIDQLQLTKEKLNYIRDFRRYVQMAIDGVMDAAHWLYSEFKFTLHLAKRPTAEEKAFLDKEGLADSVADSIKINPVTETSVIRVLFRSGDPYLAQTAINALVNEFIVHQPKTEQTSRAFFARETEQAAEKLHAAEKALADYRQKNSAYSVGVQRDLLLQGVAALRASLTQTEALRAQKQASIDALRERRLTALRVDERDKLKTERDVESEISKSLIGADVELARYTASAAALRTAIADRLDELAKLSSAELHAMELERLVTKYGQDYELKQRNLEQASNIEQMTNARISDLQLVDRASFPLTTVRPRPLLYLGIAFGAAVLAMLAAPLLAHQNDTTVTSRRDVARLLNVSFVVTIRELKAPPSSGHRWLSPPGMKLRPRPGLVWARLADLRRRLLASGSPEPSLPRQSLAPPENPRLKIQHVSEPRKEHG